MAFSARKGLPYEWCRVPDIGLPAPDLTLFLDIEPEIARQRGGYGGERYEIEQVQEGVRTVFDRIGEELRSQGKGKWVVIDAGQDKMQVAEAIWQTVEPLSRGVDSPVSKLWEDNLT